MIDGFYFFAFALDAAALPAAGVTALPPFFFDDS
jgi:hypothetical protein